MTPVRCVGDSSGSVAGVPEVGGEQWQSERSPARRLLQPHPRRLKANPPEVSPKPLAEVRFHNARHQRKSPRRRRLVRPRRFCATNVRPRSRSRQQGAHSLRNHRSDLERRTDTGASCTMEETATAQCRLKSLSSDFHELGASGVIKNKSKTRGLRQVFGGGISNLNIFCYRRADRSIVETPRTAPLCAG